jgi:hypothetical protein
VNATNKNSSRQSMPDILATSPKLLALRHRASVWYISSHMTAKKITLNEVGEMLTHVVKHMATKDDIAPRPRAWFPKRRST